MAVDVAGMTDRQLLFMANFITMTPGTLGLIFSDSKDKLYIHMMYVDDDMETLAGSSRKLTESGCDVFFEDWGLPLAVFALISSLLLVAAIGLALFRVVRGPSPFDRVVALDLIGGICLCLIVCLPSFSIRKCCSMRPS